MTAREFMDRIALLNAQVSKLVSEARAWDEPCESPGLAGPPNYVRGPLVQVGWHLLTCQSALDGKVKDENQEVSNLR